MNDVMPVLVFHLYGSLAAAVFYSVTSHPKPNAFERVAQALIFTLLVKVIVDFLLWVLSFGMENDTWRTNSSVNEFASFLIAISLGLFLAYVSNNDVSICDQTKSNFEDASITIQVPVSEIEMVEFVDSEI